MKDLVRISVPRSRAGDAGCRVQAKAAAPSGWATRRWTLAACPTLPKTDGPWTPNGFAVYCRAWCTHADHQHHRRDAVLRKEREVLARHLGGKVHHALLAELAFQHAREAPRE